MGDAERPEQMNLTVVMFGHINTGTGTRGHVGRDSLELRMPSAEQSLL